MQQFGLEELIDHTLCITGYDGDEAEVVIPDTFSDMPVTMLSDEIFKGHAEITSVKLPAHVTYLGGCVFDGCTALRALTLPAGLRYIFQYTFARSGIEEIVLPEGVVSIPPFAFKDCKALRRVVCGTALETIHAWAFQGCDALTEVVYAPGTSVSPDAFAAK